MPTGRVTGFLTEQLMTDCVVLRFGMLLGTFVTMMPLQPQNIPIMPWMVVKRCVQVNSINLFQMFWGFLQSFRG